ncbi:MAG: hypothetical protein P8X68_03485 [Desulfobacterales bacterium]
MSCKTTPTPSQPEAQAPHTQKPNETGQSTSSESTQSEQPAAAEDSRSDQKVSSTANEPESTETMEKPRTEQTVSPAASANGSKKRDQNLAEGQTTAALSAKSRLEKARDDLRVSQATEKRIAAELEQLKRSENASAEDIRNYETYLERVQAMVAENRQTVAKMEAAYTEHSPSKESSATSAPNELEQLSNPPIPEENTPDQVAELDRQLNASLSEFDAVLLKKMETIESESAAKMRDLAEQAAEAANRLKEKGEASNANKSEPSEEGSNQGGQNAKGKPGEQGGEGSAGTQKSPQAGQSGSDDTVAAGDRAAGGGPGPQHPGSRYSKEDDDIVARQLREAAEKETDPELKEKLWKEYEAYRKNTQP